MSARLRRFLTTVFTPVFTPMFRAALILCLGVCLSVQSAEARGRPWGIGALLGWPSGIAGQARLSERTRLNAALSYDIRDPSIGAHLDMIFLSRRAYIRWFYPYLGWGGRVALRGGDQEKRGRAPEGFKGAHIGARAVFGVEIGRGEWRGLFELSPTLDLLPSPQLVIGSSLGIRYHF